MSCVKLRANIIAAVAFEYSEKGCRQPVSSASHVAPLVKKGRVSSRTRAKEASAAVVSKSGSTSAPCGPALKMMIRVLPARDHEKVVVCALGVGASVLYFLRASRPVGTIGKFVCTNS